MLAVNRLRRDHPGTEVDIQYRPFLLDPKLTCKQAVDKHEYLVTKFGDQRVKQMATIIDARGSEVGIDFKWSGKIRQTTSSHRLLLLAFQKKPELQLALLEKFFHAYFEEGEDIGDPEVLARLADEVGLLTKPEALEFLGSDKLLKEVQAYILEAQQKGITGVPFTVINQKYAVCGGQKSDVYLDTFEKLVTVGEVF